MPSSRSQASLGQLKILLSAICFGSQPIFARFAYADGTSTGTLLFLRFALAGCLLLPWCLAHGLPWPRGRSLLVLVLMGSVGYAGMAACYFGGLHYASAGTIALLLYLFPAIVLLLSTLLLKEPFTRRRQLAISLALCGLLITVGQDFSAQPIGLLLGLASAVLYALYIMAGSHLVRGGHPLTAACVVVLSAAACYGGLAAVQGTALPHGSTGWLAIAGIVLAGTVAALGLLLSGLRSTSATQAALISTAEPLVTIVLAWLFLGEQLSMLQILGGGLILLAVLQISRETHQADAPLPGTEQVERAG